MKNDDPKRFLKVLGLMSVVILYIAFITVIGAIGTGTL
jgi:hypothetical protein